MSRTYRLRHEKSRVAHRFTDGRFTMHVEEVHNYWKAVVVHGIWGLPCVHLGKPILEYGLNSYSWFDVTYHSHDKCWTQLGDSWHVRHKHLDSLIPGPSLKIAAMHYHEYARPGRRSGRGRSWARGDEFHEKKGDRKKMNMTMRHVNVTLDDSLV